MTRHLPALIAVAAMGCTATIRVNASPTGADVYITEFPPLASEPPATYLVRGQAPMVATLDYFAWDDFYVWVGAPGYETYVREMPGQFKPGPFVGGCLVWFPWIWAWGPTNQPVYVDLVPTK